MIAYNVSRPSFLIPITPRPARQSAPAPILAKDEHCCSNYVIDHQLVIKVLSPIAKREYKSYLLHLKHISSHCLRSLKEDIL